MIERTVARRYATALLGLAEREKAVEAVEADIMQLGDLFRQSADFRKTMTHPLIPAKDKKEFLRKVAPDLSKLLAQFLDTLIEKDRFNTLPEIATVFDDLADQYAGVVRMTVESAMPLPEAQKAKLLAKLVKVAQGRKVDLETKVNPELLGGLTLRIRDSVVDGSVRTRLKELTEILARP